MFPFSPLTTDWKKITQWLVNVSWLYPILQWGRTSGKRHSEPKALNPWTKGRVQSATDAEEVRARSLSREILIRPEQAGEGLAASPLPRNFWQLRGCCLCRVGCLWTSPLPQVTPTPTPPLSSFKGQCGGQSRGRQLCPGPLGPVPVVTLRRIQTITGGKARPAMKAVGGALKGAQGGYQQRGQGKCSDPNNKGTDLPHWSSWSQGHSQVYHTRGQLKVSAPHTTCPRRNSIQRDQKPGPSPLNLGDIHLRNHKMECLPFHKASSRPDNPETPFPRRAVGARRTFVGPDCDPKSTKLTSVTPRVCARSQGRSIPTGRNKGCRFCRERRGEEGGRGGWQRRGGWEMNLERFPTGFFTRLRSGA